MVKIWHSNIVLEKRCYSQRYLRVLVKYVIACISYCIFGCYRQLFLFQCKFLFFQFALSEIIVLRVRGILFNLLSFLVPVLRD